MSTTRESDRRVGMGEQIPRSTSWSERLRLTSGSAAISVLQDLTLSPRLVYNGRAVNECGLH